MSIIYGSLDVTRSISYDAQIFQSSTKYNATLANTLNINFDYGNFQWASLSASTADVTCNLTNVKLGIYAVQIQQHNTVRRNVTFSASGKSIITNFSFSDAAPLTNVMVYIVAASNICYITSNIPQLQFFHTETEHYPGTLTLYDNGDGVSLYQCFSQHIKNTPFNPSGWTRITSLNADDIVYSDPYATGYTNVDEALSYLIGSAKFISNTYLSLDELISDQSNHTVNSAYLVQNVSAGSIADIRVYSGYGIYMKTAATSASVFDYFVISAEAFESTQQHFNNTIAQIPGNPTNVKLAIDALQLQINDLLDGLSFVNTWNANINVPCVGDNGLYSDGLNNSIVLSTDLSNGNIVVQTVAVGKIQSGMNVSINDVSYKISNFTILNATQTRLNLLNSKTGIVITVGANIIVGNTVHIANAQSMSGQYFIISNSVTGDNVVIDGITDYVNEKRLVSNGVQWKLIGSASVTTASEVFYDNTVEDWGTNTPENVQDAIDILRQEISNSSGVASYITDITSSTSTSSDPQILEIVNLTGVNLGMSKYTIRHGLNCTSEQLTVISVYKNTAVDNIFRSITVDTISASTYSSANPLTDVDITFTRPLLSTETYKISIVKLT